MSKITNKTNKSWVGAERSLIRDERISQKSKMIYLVLLSLAQSCDNVFPSYKFLADEIGYSSEDKSDAATGKYIRSGIKELQSINLVKVVPNSGKSNDYEIYSHEEDPSLKSKETPNLEVGSTRNSQVRSTPNLEVTLDKREEIKEKSNKKEVEATEEILQIEYNKKLLNKISELLEEVKTSMSYQQTIGSDKFKLISRETIDRYKVTIAESIVKKNIDAPVYSLTTKFNLKFGKFIETHYLTKQEQAKIEEIPKSGTDYNKLLENAITI